jgi:hypothetical protein
LKDIGIGIYIFIHWFFLFIFTTDNNNVLKKAEGVQLVVSLTQMRLVIKALHLGAA